MTPPKLAKKSLSHEPYLCQKPWPEDCRVQCGERGLVVGKTKTYRTAFFEAFPKDPHCFLRGEGKTLLEAEESCFNQLTKINSCQNHEFTRKDRTDGYAFCIHCPLSGMYLKPLTTCSVCQEPTCQYLDNQNKHYCRDHYFQLPIEQTVKIKNSLVTPEEQTYAFIEERTLLMNFKKIYPELSEKMWDKIWEEFYLIRGQIEQLYNPFLCPPTKSEQDLHCMVMISLPVIISTIQNKIT